MHSGPFQAPNTVSLVPINPFWVDFSLKCPKSGMRPTGGPHPEKKPKNLLMDMQNLLKSYAAATKVHPTDHN